MAKKSLAGLAMLLGVSVFPSHALVAQQYNDATRQSFATQGCADGTWQDQGYDSYLDCYHAWYNSYPNQPFPNP